MAAARQVILTLDGASADELPSLRENCSALMLDAEHLWLGGDEGTCVDRLRRHNDGNFGSHRRFDLAPILDLPANGKEIDIEGLETDRGYLWLIGSHSIKRKKADPDKALPKNLKLLAELATDPNRFTLARVPLDDTFTPAARVEDRRAARLEADEQGDLLTQALAEDEHVGPFCTIASKENGLDVEGLAVKGDRIFAGLRGPVLRGWAILMDLEYQETSPTSLGLASVRKHFLQLDGLGIRDLAIHQQDLYILAGPSMNLDGPVFVFRWPNALDQDSEQLVWRHELQKVLAVPYGTGNNAGRDHAEGLTFLRDPGGAALSAMVCYDSPGPDHLVEGHPDQLRVDVFPLDQDDIDG
jgi:hypothetical protein